MSLNAYGQIDKCLQSSSGTYMNNAFVKGYLLRIWFIVYQSPDITCLINSKASNTTFDNKRRRISSRVQ